MNSLPSVASAVGNKSLDGEIIANPVPGATPYSSGELTAYVRYLQGLELVATQGKGSEQIAAEGWNLDDSPPQYVLVTLIGIHDSALTPAGVGVLAQEGASHASQAFCAGASGTTPFLNKPAPTVPNGSYVICATSKAGTNDEAITSSRYNVIVIVSTTIQTLPPARLESIALDQYAALAQNAPPKPDPPPPDNLRHDIGLAAAGAAALLIVVLATIVLNDRRRRRLRRRR